MEIQNIFKTQLSILTYLFKVEMIRERNKAFQFSALLFSL
jgi:hypothetical protein